MGVRYKTRFTPDTLYLLLYTGRLGFDYHHFIDMSVPNLTFFLINHQLLKLGLGFFGKNTYLCTANTRRVTF